MFHFLMRSLGVLSAVATGVLLVAMNNGWSLAQWPQNDLPDAISQQKAADQSRLSRQVPTVQALSKTAPAASVRHQAPDRNTGTDVTALEDEVARLWQEFALLRAELTSLSTNGTNSYSGGDSSELANDAPSVEEILAHNADALEERFNNDEPGGSPSNLTMIDSVFSSPELAASQLIRSDCRASICRLEVSHNDLAAEDQFQLALAMLASEAFPSQMSHRVGGGTDTRTVAYLMRD